MVWIGMSARGLTQPIFVEPGAKINAQYYISAILTPFIDDLAPQLYPEGGYIFHQDSAPSHSAKVTLDFLKSKNIKFIHPLEHTPTSHAAPCDFFLWGYLKSQLAHRKVETIEGLKNIIRDEVRKVPITMIQDALRSWPRRLREIYYAKGYHIEN
ncbi:uncharacterized protein LOC128390280 [Panonychus citri]|uniref:uncharacterized protein LOC128390280 n=1 Tax=Panonychus citri TaxID=50023 RepID=UPI002306E54B|nr:uncharacterized protein LOC128390280 [Panonychus citri]